MDLQLESSPKRSSSFDVILAIRKDYPDARIIVLTTYSGAAHAVRSIQITARPAAGARSSSLV